MFYSWLTKKKGSRPKTRDNRGEKRRGGNPEQFETKLGPPGSAHKTGRGQKEKEVETSVP